MKKDWSSNAFYFMIVCLCDNEKWTFDQINDYLKFPKSSVYYVYTLKKTTLNGYSGAQKNILSRYFTLSLYFNK